MGRQKVRRKKELEHKKGLEGKTLQAFALSYIWN